MEDTKQKKGWFTRLKEGLTRSSSKLTEGISGIFTKKKLDDETLEELEELLITSDMGPATAAKITGALAKERFGKEVTEEEVRLFLAEQIEQILEPVAHPLELGERAGPTVLLMVGVNGAGKTTTIGKIAKNYTDQGKKVIMAAGDTFRAAAVNQLRVWGDRTGAEVIYRPDGADAAGLVFDAVERAVTEEADLLLIDTAGRLQNKAHLMQELEKINRVIAKKIPDAPHHTLLVLDATTGQNAHMQVDVFKKTVDVSGLILTKLDGSARGGVLVALAEKFGLPVHAIGVGESVEDLKPFKAGDFSKSLMGVRQ